MLSSINTLGCICKIIPIIFKRIYIFFLIITFHLLNIHVIQIFIISLNSSWCTSPAFPYPFACICWFIDFGVEMNFAGFLLPRPP